MSLFHTNSKVTTTPTALVSIPVGTRYTAVQIYNNTGAAIFIGDTTVGTTGATVGNSIANGAALQVWLGGGDVLYAVCASSPAGYTSIIYSL